MKTSREIKTSPVCVCPDGRPWTWPERIHKRHHDCCIFRERSCKKNHWFTQPQINHVATSGCSWLPTGKTWSRRFFCRFLVWPKNTFRKYTQIWNSRSTHLDKESEGLLNQISSRPHPRGSQSPPMGTEPNNRWGLKVSWMGLAGASVPCRILSGPTC